METVERYCSKLWYWILVALAVYFIKFLDLNVWLVLSLQLIVGFSVIIIICEIIRQEEYHEIKKIIFKMINR